MEGEKECTETKTKARDKPEDLTYVRSNVLGLFSFLNINNMDAATILGAFECIDTKYHQRVDVAMFSRTYVGEFDDVMILLWETFYEIMDLKNLKTPPVLATERPFSQRKDGIVEEDHKQENEYSHNHDDADHHHHHHHHLDYKHKPQYIHFLSFLTFIMYVDDRDLPYIIYWMHIHRNKKEKVNGETLNNLVRKMWGTKKSPHRQKESTKNFKRVALTLRLVTDYEDFSPNKFRLYDISSRNAFTIPFYRIRSAISINIAGGVFWKRIRLQLTEILSNNDIDAAMDKIADTNNKKKLYQEAGMRKEIRKEIRRFLRALRDYSDMPTGEDVKEIKPSIISIVINKIKEHSLFDTLRKKKILPYSRGKCDSVAVINVNENNLVSLEKKYRKSLIVPAEQLHDKAVKAKERAENLLRSCNKISSVDILGRRSKQESDNNGNGNDDNQIESEEEQEAEDNDNGAGDFNK